ncbi:MAG: hypothetical protein M3518_11095 [Actinomycetota bacterium]|nr:hypothetical protein [Actinomycetota bacterium]
MTDMTQEERARYDARADHEAWNFAVEILEPWMRVTRLTGSDELTLAMEKALGEAESERALAMNALKRLQGSRA